MERFAGPLFGALISLEVIRRGSEAAWGGVVAVLVTIQLVASVVGWGHRDFLLREFSRSPARLGERWRSSLATRLALFAVLATPALWAPWPWPIVAGGLLWCLAMIGVQAMEPLIVYRRDFLFAAAVEIGGGALVLCLVWSAHAPPTPSRLVAWFSLATWAKLAALVWRHRRTALGTGGRFDLSYFVSALPFFLLTVTGMLQSRADLLAATWLLDATQLARYQVLLNMLVLVQSGSAFLVAPWVRALYRARHPTLVAFAGRLLLAGIGIVALSLPMIHFALAHLYRIPVAAWILVLGGAMILPSYYYVPSIYELFRLGRQAAVVRINGLGALGSFGGSLLLLPGLGFAGALTAAAVSQWAVLAAYVSLARSAARGHESALS